MQKKHDSSVVWPQFGLLFDSPGQFFSVFLGVRKKNTKNVELRKFRQGMKGRPDPLGRRTRAPAETLNRLGSAQLSSAQLSSAQFSSTRLSLSLILILILIWTQLSSAQLNCDWFWLWFWFWFWFWGAKLILSLSAIYRGLTRPGQRPGEYILCFLSFLMITTKTQNGMGYFLLCLASGSFYFHVLRPPEICKEDFLPAPWIL